MASADASKKRRLVRTQTIDETHAEALVAELKSRRLDAALFHDGTLLRKLADEHLASFARLGCPVGRNRGPFGKLKWGSVCSGSEGAHFAMKFVAEALESAFGQACTVSDESHGGNFEKFELIQLFACDCSLILRKWIDRLVNTDRRASGSSLVCIFCDIRDMKNEYALCFAHGAMCPVPDVDILIVSTPWKESGSSSSSKAKAVVKPWEPATDLEHSPQTGGDAFHCGLLPYLDTHSVEIIIYENSEHLAGEGAEVGGAGVPIDIFQVEMTARQYEVQCFHLNSKLFGLPQSRRRFWAIMVKAAGTQVLAYTERSISDMFRTMRFLVTACQRFPPRAVDMLLEDTNMYVASALLQRAGKGDSTSNRNWTREHQQAYTSLRLSLGAAPPCSATAQSQWFATLSPIHKSTLVLNQHKLLMSQPIRKKEASGQAAQAATTASGQDRSTSMPRLIISVSTPIKRHCVSMLDEVGEISPPILPACSMWVHLATPRLMIGREALMFQGWPVSLVEDSPIMTDSFMHELAGICMPLPVLLSMVLSTICSVTWTRPAESNDGSSLDDLAFALQLLEGTQHGL